MPAYPAPPTFAAPATFQVCPVDVLLRRRSDCTLTGARSCRKVPSAKNAMEPATSLRQPDGRHGLRNKKQKNAIDSPGPALFPRGAMRTPAAGNMSAALTKSNRVRATHPRLGSYSGWRGRQRAPQQWKTTLFAKGDCLYPGIGHLPAQRKAAASASRR